MSLRPYLVLVPMLALFAPAQAADAIALPPAVAQQKQMFEQRPLEGTYKLSEILALSIEEGRLKAVIGPVARQSFGDRRVAIDGMRGQWKVNFRLLQGGAAPMEYLMLTRYDFDEATRGGMWSINIYVHTAGFVNVIGMLEQRTVVLTCQQGAMRLTVNEPGRAAANGAGANLDELRGSFPQEMREYVRPMLQKILGFDVMGVKSADAYRAFPQIQPDASTRQSIQALLPGLDSDISEQREKASAALGKLGPRAVLVALRMDRAQLTPEQQARLDALVSVNDERRAADPDKAQADPAFLIECLEFDDPAVREAAKSALVTLVGRRVDFNVNAPAQQRGEAADRIWKTVMVDKPKAAALPTTRSVQGVGPVN